MGNRTPIRRATISDAIHCTKPASEPTLCDCGQPAISHPIACHPAPSCRRRGRHPESHPAPRNAARRAFVMPRLSAPPVASGRPLSSRQRDVRREGRLIGRPPEESLSSFRSSYSILKVLVVPPCFSCSAFCLPSRPSSRLRGSSDVAQRQPRGGLRHLPPAHSGYRPLPRTKPNGFTDRPSSLEDYARILWFYLLLYSHIPSFFSFLPVALSAKIALCLFILFDKANGPGPCFVRGRVFPRLLWVSSPT